MNDNMFPLPLPPLLLAESSQKETADEPNSPEKSCSLPIANGPTFSTQQSPPALTLPSSCSLS